MLLFQIPSHPYYLPLVERSVVSQPHPFPKLFQGELGLLHADWKVALCTAQVLRIMAWIISIIVIIEYLQWWRQVCNPCNIGFLQMHRQLESFSLEAHLVTPRCNRWRLRCKIRPLQRGLIYWIVFWWLWMHSCSTLKSSPLSWNLWRGGSYESHHKHFCWGHIHATELHNLNIVGLRWWLVANCVSCWMKSADKVIKCQEMAGVKAANHTHVADDIDKFVFQMDCHCQWQFLNHIPLILNGLHRIVERQMGHLVEQYSLFSEAMCLWTNSWYQDGDELLLDARSDIEQMGGWLSIRHVSVTSGGVKGCFYPVMFPQSVVFHSTIDPWTQPSWETENSVTQIPAFVVWCSTCYTGLLDMCSLLYASMIWDVTNRIWDGISRNPPRTTSSMLICTSRNITHTLCAYDIATV